MTPPPALASHESRDAHGFPETSWSTILRAKEVAEARRFAAVEQLCDRYEPAIRKVFQKITRDQAGLDDLVQGFFAEKFLRPQFFANLEREGGRFREFIKQCVRNYQSNHWRKTARLARHEVLVAEPATETAAPDVNVDELLDREWALRIVGLARQRLRAESGSAGMLALCEFVEAQLDDKANLPSHAELGRQLGKSENAVGVALHRLRDRYGWLLFDEIRQTVADPTRWREERDYLLKILEHCPGDEPS